MYCPATVSQLLRIIVLLCAILAPLRHAKADEVPLNDTNLGHPVTAPHFFVAPISTELQRNVLGRDDLVTYASVDASALVAADFGLTDIRGESCASIRRAMRQLKPLATNGGIRIVVDFGLLKLDDNTERLLLDVCRGMAVGVGYAEIDAYGCWHNTEEYNWKRLAVAGGNLEEERPIKVGPALLYRVVTPLSRHLTHDADCLVQIVEPVPLDRKGIFSDQELRALGNALSRLDFRRKASARVTLFLQEPDEPYQGHELSQTRQGAAFHERTVEALQRAGFQNVKMQVQVGPSAFVSEYVDAP